MLISIRVTNILLILVLAVGIAIVAMLASGARGGPLDPPGAPTSTMKTLDDIPPSWSQVLANDLTDVCHSPRYKCVMGNSQILDRETGLVWQFAPPTGQETWLAATADCMNAQLGGRYGWRLPRMEEFRSLLDATGFLPVGVFSNVQVDYYWSSSTDPSDSTSAWATRFDLAPIQTSLPKNQLLHVWCVRGGAGLDGM